jgi:hypothetical protein
MRGLLLLCAVARSLAVEAGSAGAETAPIGTLLPRRRTVSPYAAPPLREELVRPHRTIRERRLPTPFHFQFIGTGGLAASPGSCRIIAG